MLSITEKVSGASACLEVDPSDFVVETELQKALDMGTLLLASSSDSLVVLDRLIMNEQVSECHNNN